MSDDDLSAILAENALIDAKQLSEGLGRNFTDGDMAQFQEAGINLPLAAEEFTRRYDGDNDFVNDVLKKRLRQYKKLTSGQARAALNIFRAEQGHTTSSVPEDGITCFQCEEKFSTWDKLMAHKRDMHGSTKKAPDVIAERGEAQAVIENTVSTKGLDLSNLPDGRYACPDTSGEHDNVFFMVKRVHKTHNRDRRYRFGKIVTGNEVVVAGTIEVKLWSSDSKELVGEQKPGDLYRGDLEDELELVMLNPEPFAILFGRLIGHCCICGKTLTDLDSRNIGMGIECERKQGYFKKPPTYTYIGANRPDPEKVDPNDDKYLSGQMRRYVEPPKPAVTGGR